jgi:hypothetical protein
MRINCPQPIGQCLFGRHLCKDYVEPGDLIDSRRVTTTPAITSDEERYTYGFIPGSAKWNPASTARQRCHCWYSHFSTHSARPDGHYNRARECQFDNFFEQRACMASGASAYANAKICWPEEMPSDIDLAICFSLDGASGVVGVGVNGQSVGS